MRSEKTALLTPDLRETGGVQASARTLSAHAPFKTIEIRRTFQPIYGLRCLKEFPLVARYSLAGNLLVWHLHLLPLVLPLMRVGCNFVYLHGVECWTELSRIRRLALSRATGVLYNSKHTWSSFLRANRWASEVPNEHVPLGLGEPLGKSPSPPDRRQSSGLIISRLSRSEDYKGHRELIEVWPSVRRRIPDAELLVVGDGDLKPELVSIAERVGARRFVHFLGACSEERKDELIASSRALLMPSRNEGFGLVYLEAMRRGRPCLVGNGDAGREVVDPPRCGMSVDPRNRQELEDAVVALLRADEEWEAMSVAATRRYEEHFTGRAFADRVVAALAQEKWRGRQRVSSRA